MSPGAVCPKSRAIEPFSHEESMNTLTNSNVLGSQAIVALMLFWSLVAHPTRIRSIWAIYASVGMIIVSYAGPMFFMACFPPEFQPAVGVVYSPTLIRWLACFPVLCMTCSLVFAFVAVAPSRDCPPTA
jgi:hypothetical protein